MQGLGAESFADYRQRPELLLEAAETNVVAFRARTGNPAAGR